MQAPCYTCWSFELRRNVRDTWAYGTIGIGAESIHGWYPTAFADEEDDAVQTSEGRGSSEDSDSESEVD